MHFSHLNTPINNISKNIPFLWQGRFCLFVNQALYIELARISEKKSYDCCLQYLIIIYEKMKSNIWHFYPRGSEALHKKVLSEKYYKYHLALTLIVLLFVVKNDINIDTSIWHNTQENLTSFFLLQKWANQRKLHTCLQCEWAPGESHTVLVVSFFLRFSSSSNTYYIFFFPCFPFFQRKMQKPASYKFLTITIGGNQKP